MSQTAAKVYEVIVRRFLSIFLPPATYQKVAVETCIGSEHFFASFKVTLDEGYLKIASIYPKSSTKSQDKSEDGSDSEDEENVEEVPEVSEENSSSKYAFVL